MEYEFEPELEDSYRASLIKSFKRQVDEGFFPFIIIDCINNRVSYFSEIASYAKQHGFEVRLGWGWCGVRKVCVLDMLWW